MGALPTPRQGGNRKEKIMKFEDYYRNVGTLEKPREVGVSAGVFADADCVLLQVEREDGNYECAYISREQAKEIGEALLKIAALPMSVAGETVDEILDSNKALGSLRKGERFAFCSEDGAEFRVERHTDEKVWASMRHGETWRGLHSFGVDTMVFVIGGGAL